MKFRSPIILSCELLAFTARSVNNAGMEGTVESEHDNCLQPIQDYLGVEALHISNTTQRAQQACVENVTIEELIKDNVDLQMNNDNAIKTAADMNNNQLVKNLFDNGCKSFEVIEYILKTAAKNGNLDLVRFAYGRGFSTQDLRDIAIAEAVLYGHLGIVEELFVNDIFDSRSMVLCAYFYELAQIKGFTDIKFFFEDKAKKFESEKYDTLIWVASYFGHIDVVEHLLENGADVHSTDEKPIRCASRRGHTNVVELLLSRGANVHTFCDEALRWACKNGHTGVVRLLLQNEANVHADGDWAIRWACEYGHIDVVKILIEYGADMHVENDWPLRWASYNGHGNVVKLLFEY